MAKKEVPTVPAVVVPAALPPNFKPALVDFVEYRGQHIPIATLHNTIAALLIVQVDCWQDMFTGKRYIGDNPLNTEVGGQINDEAVTLLRVLIREQCGFTPKKDQMFDAVYLLCRANGRHPIKEKLEACVWDGVPRIDMMLHEVFGVEDTAFTRGVSRIVMVASVRRIYEPGAKFDYMPVLESDEGWDKSSGLALLYGEQWFSDQTLLGLNDKELQEAVRGRWCNECADLSGMRKAEVEKTKAQLSRCEDRARPAYGRSVLDVPRSNVFWGTTNDREYLKSQTGNRRFLPLRMIRRVDIKLLRETRDLLWAEAIEAHKAGESIMLPVSLWEAARLEQQKRLLEHPWADMLADLSGHIKYKEDGTEIIATKTLFEFLQIKPDRATPEHSKQLGMTMRKLGWDGPKAIRFNNGVAKGYERPADPLFDDAAMFPRS